LRAARYGTKLIAELAQISDVSMPELDIREKLAHIDLMLADHDRKRQEIRLAPWQLVMTSMAGGGALFAAGAAFFKLLVGP
jgi:hypothetical protein